MGGSNQMIEPGNVSIAAPYRISGRTGVLSGVTAGQSLATLVHFGMLFQGAIVPTTIRLSQIRMKYVSTTTSAAIGVAIEVVRGTATTQRTTGTTPSSHAPQKRKTTGYPVIGLTETSLFVAGTDAIGGGNFAANDASSPIDVLVNDAGLSSGASFWEPSDLCPEVLEAGEALDVRVLQAGTGTGILFLAFDFLR